jgi:iron complex transport system substrate-binding protein
VIPGLLPPDPPASSEARFPVDASSRTVRLSLVTILAVVLAACSGAGGASPSTSPAGSAAAPSAAPTEVPAASPSAVAAFPVTLTDDEGTEVEIAARPVRVVSLTPATTETLFAIGAGDQVVAKVEDIAPYPPEADDLPVVATFQGVDVERIVELEADLVIAGGVNFNQADAIEQLRRLDVPVLVLYPESTSGALHGIELIGDAVGAGDAARDLTASMRAGFDGVAAATQDLPRPRVFYEIDATTTIFTPAAGSVYAEMLELAGSDPILTDDSYVISLEELVVADPEIILLGNPMATPDHVRERPGWDGMTAVENGAIHPVNDTVITRPGPRLVDGLRELAMTIHPDTVLPSPVPAGGY